MSDLKYILHRLFNTHLVSLKHVNVRSEFLSECERSGVHQVCAADLDDVFELITLLGKDFDQSLELGEEGLMEFGDSGDMHHRREGIVGALAAVDMVIRMNHFRA